MVHKNNKTMENKKIVGSTEKSDTDLINESMAEIRAMQDAKRLEDSKPKRTYKDLIREEEQKMGIPHVEKKSKELPRLSKYRGVCYFKPTGQWTANIKIRGTRIVRYCDTEEGAAKTYDQLAVKARGEAAVTNFPIEEYEMPDPKEDRVYVDRECRGRTDWYRNALESYIAIKRASYRDRSANWVIVSDLFFAGEVPDDIMEICEEMGVKGSEFYL